MSFLKLYRLHRYLPPYEIHFPISCRKILFKPLTIYCKSLRAMSFEPNGDGLKNHLHKERSPYLLQHATNPVDWYPWGDEAFQKAKMENKLIFLSVGYSTCHWCHVMEKESFMNTDIAAVMNQHFINIKVDREERPDIDKLYMAFVQAISDSGGWPMSVWLTPDLKPVFGGTYFPPDDRYYGRKGLMNILKLLALQWETSQKDILDSASNIIKALKENASIGGSTPDAYESNLPFPNCPHICFHQLEKSFDSKFGGFGSAPKFPQPVNLDLLLDYFATNVDTDEGKRALEMCLFTLDKMSLGGIHDHVSQGFARYSTDGEWHVPHFEKMLYDQAQLTATYSIAYAVTHKAHYLNIIDDILTYVRRDLSHPSGGCYSAEDADSYPTLDSVHKKEGAFCVWTMNEINTHLNDIPSKSNKFTAVEIFKYHYGVQETGNVRPHKDPHNELTNQNVLIVRGSDEETADHFDISVEDFHQMISKCLEKLHNIRQTRPKPQQDTKIIASWNGMMLSGYALAAQYTNKSEYKKRAIAIKNFLREHLWKEESGELLRSIYIGSDEAICQISTPISGFCDDYAMVIQGLLDLYELCFDSSLIQWANQLQTKQDELFWDSQDGGYFFSSNRDPSIPIRMKEDQDGAEPCSNSVAVGNLMRLSYYMGCDSYREKAGMVLATFSERLNKVPIVLPKMVTGFLWYSRPPCMVILTGDLESDVTKSLLKTIYGQYIPHRVLIHYDTNSQSTFYGNSKLLQSFSYEEGIPKVYICNNFACSLPATTPEELEINIKAAMKG